MAPTLSLFSRRKPSSSSTAEDDRALRARLSPQLPPTPPPPPPASTKKHTSHNSISARSKTSDNLTLYPPQSPASRPPTSLVRSSSDASLQMSRATTRAQTPESLVSSGARSSGNGGRRKPSVPELTPLSSVNGNKARRKDSLSSIVFTSTSTGSSVTGSGYGTLPQNVPLPESVPSTPATATLPLTSGGRVFFGRQLPMSPPLSPESPGGLVIGRKRSEADAIHVAALMAKAPASESDPTRALASRIAHLESTNNSLTNELSQHSTRITNLLHSHSAVISSLKESHALELSSAHTAAFASASNELSSLNTRIAQLEYLCESLSNSNPNAAELTQQLLNEQRLRCAAEAATLRAREDLESVLTSERENAYILQEKVEKAEQARITAQHRAKKDLDYVLTEEEKRRAELNWVYSEKMERIDAQRRKQEAELKKVAEQRKTLETLLKEAQQEMSTLKQGGAKSGGGQADRDLLHLNQTLTSRLSTEKSKNKSLENSIASITSTSLTTVSTANHEVQKMRNTIEDLTTHNSRLDSELKAITKERNNLNEAWQSAYAELETRDERITDLESECGELRDLLATRNSELEGARRHAEAQENLFATLSPVEEIGKEMRDLKDDLELYKADIRVYKRDVRKRDCEIRRLNDDNLALRKALEEAESGSGNERGSLGMGLISTFPEPSTTASGLKIENESLKAANEQLRKGSQQQKIMISSLETKLKEREEEKLGVKRTASRRPKEGGVEIYGGKKRDRDRVISNHSPPPPFLPPQIPSVLTAPPPQPPSPEHLTAMLENRPPSYPPPPRPPPKDSAQQPGRSLSSASSSDETVGVGRNRSVDGRGKDGRRTIESPLPPPPDEEGGEEEGETYEW